MLRRLLFGALALFAGSASADDIMEKEVVIEPQIVWSGGTGANVWNVSLQFDGAVVISERVEDGTFKFHGVGVDVPDFDLKREWFAHAVAHFPDGRWLAYNSRTKSGINNGHVFDAGGRYSHSLFLGDGIEHVQIDSQNQIWIGYFDEGVYGATELGHEGLVILHPDTGMVQFKHNSTGGVEPIDDLYAMNVSSAGIGYIYPYSNFKLWSVKGGKLQLLADKLPAGAKALMISGSYLILLGCYDDRKQIFVLNLKSQIYRLGKLNVIDQRWSGSGRGDKVVIYDGQNAALVTATAVLESFGAWTAENSWPVGEGPAFIEQEEGGTVMIRVN